MKIHMPVLLASCLFASQSFAGGLADPIIPIAPPPPPVVVPLDWYAGLQVGVLSGEAEGDGVNDLLATDIEGTIFGLHAGVQRSFGSFTLSGEIDWNTTDGNLADDDALATIEMDTLAHLKLRAGTNIGSVFVYGTAGLAYTSMSISPFPGTVDEVTDTAPFFGIGADVMVSQSISVGGEFLVHSFEDIDGTGSDVDFNTAMLRASYHF